jgi:branched-chain amino acid aminotransferase
MTTETKPEAKAQSTSTGAMPRNGTKPETGLVCWFNGSWTPLGDAKVGIMTHAFLYGTATFEGIRAYWNEDHGQLYALKMPEHFQRLTNSARIMLMDCGMSVDELVALGTELLRRNGFREDAYMRPTLYKATEAIGVRLHNLESKLNVFAVPFGEYISIDRGISAETVSWRRTNDVSIPSRAKIVGSYVNPAFSKTEAQLNGYDEAIVLTSDGHVSEGSAENLFMVRGGELLTPGVEDDILEGVTRAGMIELAEKELGLTTQVRSIDRSELYVCDELFLCGTGAQISPVTSVDHRPVGNGDIGPITQKLTELYFDAVRGKLPAYRTWVTPIY